MIEAIVDQPVKIRKKKTMSKQSSEIKLQQQCYHDCFLFSVPSEVI